MQKAYINSLYKLLQKDKNVISCLSDSGTDYDEMIAREFPTQVINFGISENNKVAAAAGLASCGKIPFVYTTSAFLVYRSYEFIRDDICLQNYNVKLIGMGSGLSWSTLGPTHHTTEDIALLYQLPNLTILSPCSPKELEQCIDYAYNHIGPVYVRMGMSNEKEIYDENYKFIFGKNNLIKEGKDISIYVTGSIINEVIEASNKLESDGFSIKIVNVATIKPFDKNSIINEKNKYIVTVEEQNILGGIGSIIGNIIAENNLDIKLYKIGLNDSFAKGYGTYKEMLKMNNLDGDSIYNIINSILSQ